jgi:hypothetical protein
VALGRPTIDIVTMRDLPTIDAELRLLVAVRRVVAEQGGPQPSIGPANKLLDERGAVVRHYPNRGSEKTSAQGTAEWVSGETDDRRSSLHWRRRRSAA